MLLVIFYCGLIPFVVFARPANDPSPTDTGNNNDAWLIVGKSTNTTNADNGIDCAPQINENDITNIVERTESDQVNIIDFRFFDGEGQDQRLFEDMKITLVTLVGREILLILSNMEYSYITLTLNAGRENRNVHFKNVSLKNCNEKHVALSILEQIVLRVKNPKIHEVCYGETQDKYIDQYVGQYNPVKIKFRLQKYRWICCRITNTDLTNFQHVCLERNPFLQGFLALLTILTIISLPLYFARLLRMLLSNSLFKIIHPEYYTLHESTMSLTSLLVRIVWDEQGSICVSIGRRCAITFVLFGNIYLCVSQASSSVTLWYLFMCCVLISYAFFMVTVIFIFGGWKFEKHRIERALLKFREFPFNLKPESRIKSILLVPVSVVCLVFTSFVFIVFIRHEYNVKIFKSWLPRFFLSFDILVAYGFAIFQFNTYYALTYAVQFFLLGLFLNLAYFLPYLAAISVFTFYFYGTWKSLEQKYFLLKLLIYEECQARKPDTDEDETLPEQDQKIHCVVPKEIYHSIRKELLPYDKSLFWVVLQLLWLLVLSYGVSELVRMLRTFNTTATLKVLATASVGILPHMCNTIFWDAKGGDGKEPWKKELKENVKRLAETLPIHKIVLSLPTITGTASSEAEQNSESGVQSQNDENDEPQNVENDEPQNVENDEPQNVENAESQNVENDESQNVENAEPQNDENDEPQNVENDEPQNVENDESQNVENAESQNDENDEPQNVENDESQNVENDESQNVENDESQNVENAESQNDENDEPHNVENDEPQNVENDESQNVENAESQNDENDEPQNVENDESQNVENDESQNVENDEPQNDENDEPQNVENDESHIVENDEPQIDENDEYARLLTSHKDEDIQNEIGYVLKLLGD